MQKSDLSILQLPLEILLEIKACVPLSDLRTHVCLYNTHPSIAALYDSDKDADRFWELCCWNCGIGAIWDDLDNGKPRWKNIALDTIARDGFCTHPQCGESLLDYNRQRMQQVLNKHKEPIKPPVAWKNKEGRIIPVSLHRVLLAFQFGPSDDQASDMLGDCYLRADASTQRPYEGSLLLRDHPLVYRSYATDLPVKKIRLGPFDDFEVPGYNTTADGVSAVTVHDVLYYLYIE
ncbi:hypothetical protein OH77DRAFT_1411333 [Trametes cingulata]|nr:hypothetical protein OH77DRAFT_1411333 [Trametes cingulata]